MGGNIFRNFYNLYWVCNVYQSQKIEINFEKSGQYKFYKLRGNNNPIDTRYCPNIIRGFF